VEPSPINRKFPSLNLVVYRSESNFYSAFYLIFSLYYNLLSFLGPFDGKDCGVGILRFGVIHKKLAQLFSHSVIELLGPLGY